MQQQSSKASASQQNTGGGGVQTNIGVNQSSISQLQNMIKLVKLDTQQLQNQQLQMQGGQAYSQRAGSASPIKPLSPQKMVVLAAESNEMLAQLMRASASILSQNLYTLPGTPNLPLNGSANSTTTPERQHLFQQPMQRSPCIRLTPFNERQNLQQQPAQQQQLQCSPQAQPSPQILKLFSIKEEEHEDRKRALQKGTNGKCTHQSSSHRPMMASKSKSPISGRQAKPATISNQNSDKKSNKLGEQFFSVNSPPNQIPSSLSSAQGTAAHPSPKRLRFSPAQSRDKPNEHAQNKEDSAEDPVHLAKQQASNLFELGLQMSQTALNYLQTVIKREKSKASGQRRHSPDDSSSKGVTSKQNNRKQLNNDLNNHLHFSTLQLSEVKKEGSFLDDPRSPNHLFSACTTENNHLLSRSRSHKKEISEDWTSSKKDKVTLPALSTQQQNPASSECSSSQQHVSLRKSLQTQKQHQQPSTQKPQRKLRLGSIQGPLDSFQSMGGHLDHAFYQETPSSVKKSKQTLFRERELRIKEFSEMNEKLNLMKEQFKQEMMRSQHQFHIAQTAQQESEMIDQQMRQLSSSYGDRSKVFRDEKKRRRPGIQQQSRNSMSGARKSVQNLPSRSRDLDVPMNSQYIDVVTTQKPSRALPRSILACRTSIQSMQPQSLPRRSENSVESSHKRLPRKKSNYKVNGPQDYHHPFQEESKLSSTIKKIKIEKQLTKQRLLSSTTSSLGSVSLGGTRNSMAAYHPMSPVNQSTINLKDISFGKPSQQSFTSKRSSICNIEDGKTVNFFKTFARDQKIGASSAMRKERDRSALSKKSILGLNNVSKTHSNSTTIQLDQEFKMLRPQSRERRGIQVQAPKDPAALTLTRPETPQSSKRRNAEMKNKRQSVADMSTTKLLAMDAKLKFHTKLQVQKKIPAKIIGMSVTPVQNTGTQTMNMAAGPQGHQQTQFQSRRRSQPHANEDLNDQFFMANEKVNYYKKLINFATIIDFKRQGLVQQRSNKTEGSKACIRAARSLCMLLDAFYMSEQQSQFGPTQSFESWSEICGFIHRHSHRIIQDITGGLQARIESASSFSKLNDTFSPLCQQYLLRIYREIYLQDPSEITNAYIIPISSPRVRNLQFKPVFCFVYFLITSFIIKKRITELQSGSHNNLQALGGDLQHHQEIVTSSSLTRSVKQSFAGKSTQKELSQIKEKQHTARRQKTPEQLPSKRRSPTPTKVAHSKSVEGNALSRDVAKKIPLTKSFDIQSTKQLLLKPRTVLKQVPGRFDLPLQRSQQLKLRSSNTTPTSPYCVPVLQRANDSIRTSKDNMHPYLKDTIRPLYTLQRILSDQQTQDLILRAHNNSQIATNSSGPLLTTTKQQQNSVRRQPKSEASTPSSVVRHHHQQLQSMMNETMKSTISQAAPSRKSATTASPLQPQGKEKRIENRIFDELEKEVEHHFQQLQLNGGGPAMFNQSSILDSSMASIKSTLLNLTGFQRPLNIYKGSQTAPMTTQLTPQASVGHLRSSLSPVVAHHVLSDHEKSQSKHQALIPPLPIGLIHATNAQLDGVQPNHQLPCFQSNPSLNATTNTSFSSTAKKSTTSLTQQRREIVDRLIDTRKQKSADKKPSIIHQSQVASNPGVLSNETTLDENAWHLIKEMGRGTAQQFPQFVSSQSTQNLHHRQQQQNQQRNLRQ